MVDFELRSKLILYGGNFEFDVNNSFFKKYNFRFFFIFGFLRYIFK